MRGAVSSAIMPRVDKLLGLLRDWRWPIVSIAAGAAALAGAHAFEIFGRMAPCPLCLRQREVYWAALAMAATGLALWRWRPNERFLVALNVMLGLVFVTGAVVAAYHAGVEWLWWEGPAGCAGGVAGADALRSGDLFGGLDRPLATVSCVDAPWRMLGLSMAGWNALISLGLGAASLLAAQRTGRRLS